MTRHSIHDVQHPTAENPDDGIVARAIDLTKVYGSKDNEVMALDHVNVEFKRGEMTAIMGPSGSGKSTLMHCMAGLDTPSSGKVIVEGLEVSSMNQQQLTDLRREQIGFIFQSFNLVPTLSAEENILLPLQIAKRPIDREWFNQVVKVVGLEKRLTHRPSQLSGGQRQRVAFARALAPNPQVLLLDEPFAAIDAKIRQELRSWLKEMIGKLGITRIFVTHDQDEAIEVADEIIITNAGRIEQKGTPIGVYRNPETAFTASFFGQPSVLKNADDFHTFAQAEEADKIIVRPEFVKISKLDEVEKFKTSVSRGVVERVSFRGDNLELQVRVNNSVITARRSLEKADIREGETVNVFLYRIFALRGDSVQLIENEPVRDYFVIICQRWLRRLTTMKK